jgi:PTS system mannose-specific IIC component
MTGVSALRELALLAWGTVVGLDLVSGPQAMLARPVVAGTVAGAILQDVEAGLRVGVLLELFALDVLPIGATRYPDYGPATVVAVALAANAPWELSLGLSVALGLVVALAGGWTMQWLRHANARAIQRRAAALAAGERKAIRLLQYGGLARDALRSGGITILGLGLAVWAQRDLRPDRLTADALTLVAIGAALAAALGGAVRSAGRGPRLRWLGAGLLVGTLGALLR